MNSKAALLLMLCAIAIACFLHSRKLSAKDNDMDKLAKGLDGIQTHIKPGTRILIDNKTSKDDIPFRARFLLVPSIVNLSGTNDTILSISQKSDAPLIDSTRKQLWSNSDSLYNYILTCPH